MTLSFIPANQSLLYIPAGVPIVAAHVGFLLPAGTMNPPATISLTQSLQSYPQGTYLFFASLPYDPVHPDRFNQFILSLHTYLTTLTTFTQPAPRFVWLYNPTSFAAGLNGLPLRVTIQGTNILTTRATAIPLAPNIALRISGGTQITPDPTTMALVFTSNPTSSMALVVAPQGGQSQVTLPLQPSSLKLNLLDPTVPQGCFTLGLSLNLAGMNALDVGLRYFTPYLNTATPGYVQSLRYPLFNPLPAHPITFSGSFDPLAPLDPLRTSLTFVPNQTIGSFFSSVLNSPVTLQPQASAQLFFTPRLTVLPDPETSQLTTVPEPYYLTPSGTFNLMIVGETTPPPNTPPDLLNCLACGFFGIEYFPLPQGLGTITFASGQPAYAPIIQQTDTGTPPQTTILYQNLLPIATTSWAAISAPTPQVQYYAQPESSVLHQPAAPFSTVPALFLTYLPVLAGTLSSASALTQFYPLVPYSGINTDPLITDLTPYAQLEYQVLNPLRRNRIYEFSAPLQVQTHHATPYTPQTLPAGTQGTTPEGLLLTLSGDQWLTLLLAQTTDQSGNVTPLLLANVQGPLKAALQTNQLFTVISSPTQLLANSTLTSYTFTIQSKTDLEQSQNPVIPSTVISTLWNDPNFPNKIYSSLAIFQQDLQSLLNPSDYTKYGTLITDVSALLRLYIQDWTFDLNPYFWSSYSTLLIFKFTHGKLLNLAQDTTSWVQGTNLNDDVNSTQQQLQAIFAAALADMSPDMAYFQTTVLNDPNWNGILALNCRVPLSALPPQLEGLAAGINVNQFFAHHVGISVTPITTDTHTGMLTPHDSSLFALIRYDDSAPLSNPSADYDFKVLALHILFANSAVSTFSSQIELLINKLFLEPVTLQNSQQGNNIQLNGVYQKHGDHGSYVFSTQNSSIYQVNSHVLSSVEITQAQFATLIPPQGLQTGAPVQTRFTFVGNIQFLALPAFDLFSFGAPTPGAGGLTFNQLSLDMSFPPDTPTAKTFAFDAHQITFDTATSVIHPASLYAHFPLKLTGLLQADQNGTTTDLGYMLVDSPLNSTALTLPWFGLVYDLNLGSLGALAGPAGFVASLLTAWSPDPNNATVLIGLRIPGVTGGKREISIEEVVRLTFGNLRFVVNAPSYILQIRSIALHLLSLSFPPGQTDILLFGDPAGLDNTTLGWYAAYKKPDQGGSSPPSTQQSTALPALHPPTPTKGV